MGKRKKKNDDDSGADIGMVMTVSLFLILLTFFILLNSIAVIDDHRTRLAIGSLIGAFGGLPGGLSPMDTGKKSVLPPSAPMLEEQLSLEQLMSYVQRDLKELEGDIKLENIGDEHRIILSEMSLFTQNNYKIKPSIQPLLDKLGQIINKGSFPVEIAGYTDNVIHPERGYKSNWELSAIMALKVFKYLVSECKVSPNRLTAYGCGSNRPIALNDTRQSRAKNRRIEIDLKYKAPAYIRRIFKKKPAGFFTYKKFDFKIY